MKRRGFTIIELLMVVGIISVLITISTTAIKGSITSARKQRAEALCTLVEQGIAAYYAQKDEWPVSSCNNESLTLDSNKDYYTLKDDEVREAVRKIVLETKNNNPLIDVSGLFVAQSQNAKSGMDFMEARRGTKRNPKKMAVNDMYYGYPDAETGHFKIFKMRYYPDSDTIKVTQK